MPRGCLLPISYPQLQSYDVSSFFLFDHCSPSISAESSEKNSNLCWDLHCPFFSILNVEGCENGAVQPDLVVLLSAPPGRKGVGWPALAIGPDPAVNNTAAFSSSVLRDFKGPICSLLVL